MVRINCLQKRVSLKWVGIFLLTCMICSCKSKYYAFTLKGDFINVDTATVELLSVEDGPGCLLSTSMRDGKFKLRGRLPEPGCYVLKIGDKHVQVVLDGEDMYWPSDYEEIDVDYLKGNPATRSRLSMYEMVRETYQLPVKQMSTGLINAWGNGELTPAQEEELEKVKHQEFEKLGDRLLAYVSAHDGDLYVPVFLREHMGEFGHAWAEKGYELLRPENKNSQPGRLLKTYLDRMASSAEGTPFPDVEMSMPTGEVITKKFNDGKVYVIDFWASWCAPCRAMIPRLKELHDSLAGQSVCFVSISLDSRKEDWLKANEEENLPWESYWLEEGFDSSIARELGIEAIPFIIVLDGHGRIVGKNLRDYALKNKLTKLLEEK